MAGYCNNQRLLRYSKDLKEGSDTLGCLVSIDERHAAITQDYGIVAHILIADWADALDGC